MAIPSNPIAIFRPNWKGGIVERLSWLTSVATSTNGHEQRRQVRLTPRRSFEITYNRQGRERAFFDLWMTNLGAEDVFLPLWHDQAPLAAACEAGDGRLELDTAFREFTVGGYAVVVLDSFNYEIVEIAGIDEDGLDLADFTQNAWSRKATVYPLRIARLSPDSTAQALSSRVNQATLLFTLTDANPFDEGSWEDQYRIEDKPCITIEPNRVEQIDTSYNYIVSEQDQQLGRVRRVSLMDAAFNTQSYNWWAHGREQRHALRQMLYRLKGRFQSVYMPTFSDDVVIAEDAPQGAAWVTIENIGYHIVKAIAEGLTEDDELSKGRRRVLFRAGSNFDDIFIYSSTSQGDTEELTLHSSKLVEIDLPAGTTGSFAELMRLDQDTIEIYHHTDSEGLMEVSAAFRSLVADDPAPRVGNWLYKVWLDVETPGASPNTALGLQLYGPWATWGPDEDGRPNGPGGVLIPGGAFVGLGGQQLENNRGVDHPENPTGNPNLRGQPIWRSAGGIYNWVTTFYTRPPKGNWQMTTQYPANNWSDVGLPDGSPLAVKVKSWDSPGFATVDSGMAVGLWPAYWYWSSN